MTDVETSKQEIARLKEALSLTLDLIAAYRKLNIKAPFGLRGNLGEFIVAIEMLKQFKSHRISYRGGSSPDYDIEIDGKKMHKNMFCHVAPLAPCRNARICWNSGSPRISAISL